jgi:hypothetical protein
MVRARGVFAVSRAELYKEVPTGAGPFGYIEHEVFEEVGDIDVLFVGSSLLWAGIESDTVERALSSALGRPAKVVVLGSNWQGADLPYVLLRDVLARRRVGMVALSGPLATFIPDTPHLQAHRWARYGEYPEVTEAMPFRSSMSLYAAGVLGAPRHLVSWLRPNRVSPAELDPEWLRSEHAQQGYHGVPFVVEDRTAVDVPTESMISKPSSPGVFRILGSTPGPYERAFLKATGELLRRNGVAAIAIHVPTARERGEDVVRERFRWDEELGTPCPVIGVPSATLFGGKTPEQVLHYYYDEHLNRNGAARFTATIAPAIARAYEAKVAKHP